MNPPLKLSNDELELQLSNLVQRERKLLHVILEHIKEIDRRRLYLERAYPSMYEYLTQKYGYSGSAAIRRIEAARLMSDVPEVAKQIQDGHINLSQIGELAKAIKQKERSTREKISKENKADLVTAILGKSAKETQKELALALDIELKTPESTKIQKNDSVHVTVTFTKEEYELFQKCKDLAGHILSQKHRDHSWASLFVTLGEQFVRKMNPPARAPKARRVHEPASAEEAFSSVPSFDAVSYLQ